MFEEIKVEVRRLNHNVDLPLPEYETEGAAGMDLRAALDGNVTLRPGEIRRIPTGLAFSIPKGYEGQVRPRSGLALRHGIGMVNAPGTIDSDYRGEVGLILINWGTESFLIKRGDRIAQMIIQKVYRVEPEEVDTLEETARNTGGFGHTGT